NGKVVLTAVVAADGRVRTVNVISGSKIFASAARRAVREWRYLPYELHGTAIEFQTTIAFNFRGNEVISISFPQL
ncbi:MAG: TonB family protein, partial [Acidobacteria bacterium]|nr:TonB family protein [Acidobacteriota bacterium]